MLGLTKNEQKKKEYFFALEINVDRVKSAIWTIEDSQTKIAALGDICPWSNDEDLLEGIDTSLSSAVEKFSTEEKASEPNKVIFGLSADWAEQNKILTSKTEILKKISQKLELKPLGFIIIPEAITHWLKKLEGVPPTAVLVGLTAKKIVVSLVDLGKVIETNLVIRSENIAQDLTEGLFRMQKDVPFPARILLYDGEQDLEEIRQDLIRWHWQDDKITFLHLPKVEILASDFDIKSVVFASASQVADVQGVEFMDPAFSEKKDTFEQESKIEEKELETESLPSPESSSVEKTDLAEEKQDNQPETEVENQGEQVQLETASNPEVVPPAPGFALENQGLLGFLKNRDISQEQTPPVFPEVENSQSTEGEVSQSSTDQPLPNSGSSFLDKKQLFKPKLNFGWAKAVNLTGLTSFFQNIFSSNRFDLERSRFPKIFILIGLLVLVLASGLFAAYWYLPKVEITLYAEPKTLEKDFMIKLDPDLTSIDKENSTLPGHEVKTTVEGEKQVGTTGIKLIGEAAKGEVTIYNRTSSEKTFAQGTEINGPNDLAFALDDEVKVASKSAGSDYVEIPGKSTVAVTAVEIGTDGNLASGTEFTIANFASSDFVAKNEAAFTGGTSREVQVVSKEDQANLLEDLEESLKQEGADKLKKEVGSNQNLVEQSIETQVVSKSYNRKIDEESNQLGLSLEVEIVALSFNQQDFQDLINEEILKLVPDGFDYDPQETETSFSIDDDSDQKNLSFSAHFKANLIPKINLEEIKNNLVGKKPAIGKTYLNNLPNVASFEAQITPKLPSGMVTFPHLAKKINIEVKLK